MSLRSRLFARQPIEMLVRDPASSPLPRTLGMFSLTVWLLLGFALYAAYGFRHSLLHRSGA